MTIDPELLSRVRDWLADDPDASTRQELTALLESDDELELADHFAGMLEFGTAGLRGLLGAGPNRMNRAVVGRATAGFVAHLLDQVSDAAARGLCLGYDGRHRSRDFAEDVAEIATGAGVRVRMFDEPIPTPLLAFAVRDQGAAGGVMITASHNPAAYNGYKVYWENGAQIIPPHDAGIAARIRDVGRLSDVARLRRDEALRRGLLEPIGPELESRYVDGVLQLLPHPEVPRTIAIALTSLHGVGARLARRVFSTAGFRDVFEVAEQAEPDPDFPTVAFPNPEEDGAMDRVLALAASKHADLALAHDPDADRLAAAVRAHDGRWVELNGNEIGCLLGSYVLTESRSPTPSAKRLTLSTIVSSPLLGAIARAAGAAHEQTLTGFKWIANRALARERDEGLAFVFGYEEALGYCVGTLVRDKDGIAAGAVLADMAAFAASRGRTLLDDLDAIYRRHGLFLSRQVSLHLPGRDGLDRIRAIMTHARTERPSALAGTVVEHVVDLEAGQRVDRAGTTKPLAFPRTDLVVYELEGGHRAMLRPSGTEPKLKYYVDACIPVADDEPLAAARARGERFLDRLIDDLRRAVE